MRISLPALVRAVRTLGASRANMLVIGVVYGIYAVSLAVQPARWGLTPAYRNLLALMPQQAWGAAFGAVAVLLLAAVRWHGRHRLSVLAITCAMALTTFWTAAFVIRWLTNTSTTPETWTSWAVFDFLLSRALYLLGYQEVRVRPLRGEDRRG